MRKYNKNQFELNIYQLSIIDRVKNVFKRYPTAIHSNNYLIIYYKYLYGNTEGRDTEILNTGRHLRKLCKDRLCGHQDTSECYVKDMKNCIEAIERESLYAELKGF